MCVLVSLGALSISGSGDWISVTERLVDKSRAKETVRLVFRTVLTHPYLKWPRPMFAYF